MIDYIKSLIPYIILGVVFGLIFYVILFVIPYYAFNGCHPEIWYLFTDNCEG